jgi:ribosome-interacting GTPase 1
MGAPGNAKAPRGQHSGHLERCFPKVASAIPCDEQAHYNWASGMKLEIEIAEDDIRDAIKKKIDYILTVVSSSYSNEEAIEDLIKKHWKENMVRIVEEEMKNEDALRAKIQKALENKIRAQMARLLKDASKEAKE